MAPEEIEERIQNIPLVEEMKASYLTYAMSVIVSRALPDVRDGLKPSQRRILAAMKDLNLGPRAKYRKCAKIAGDTSGNYHPHGEQVIYPTLVRLAQDFAMRYPLVDGQGNFGSMDGDPPAAMRYTEARMTQAAVEMLDDIERDTVDFVPNYDETRTEPVVLPSRLPNLLVNGSSGIAVGMATSIPPHNLEEVCDAVVRVIEEPDVPLNELMKVVQGPDFPTGGIICGRKGIRDAYTSGKGLITLRARIHREEDSKGRVSLVVTEIPYQLNRTKLIEKIADLVKSGKLPAVSDIRDESDRDGSRLVLEIRRGDDDEVVLNRLYKNTPLQETFSVNMIALVDGGPRLMNLKEMIRCFIDHRIEVIRRRTEFLLREAEARAHILDGLRVALADIDEVVRLIKASRDPEEASAGLRKRFHLSEIQAGAILRMSLSKLTGLEQEKIEKEYHDLLEKIAEYRKILADEALVLDIIREDCFDMKARFKGDRRTEITEAVQAFQMEDLIAEEDMAVTLSNEGYVKRQPLSGWRRQRRGGKGITGASMKHGDFIEHLFIASTYDTLLIFSDRGKVYGLKVYEVPKLARQSRGRSLRNLLSLPHGDSVASVIAIRSFDDRYVLMASARGTIKKTILSAFQNTRRSGIIAVKVDAADRLVGALLTTGDDNVLLGTKQGMALRFHERDARPMGRSAQGVRGITLRPRDEVVGLCVAKSDLSVLTVCDKGYGKRTLFNAYRTQRRGGKGLINIRTTGRNGEAVAVMTVSDGDDLLAVTAKGMMVRMPVANISVIGRATQGVRLVGLKDRDRVVSVARVVEEE
ncbi:MAG: DNA gyrase subunit A [Planctomycetota bacterium]|jgi:DNA gyrase subunit A